MKPELIKQYRRSFAYEIKRFGFDMEFATELDAPHMEFEGDTVCLTTPSDHVRLHIVDACNALYGLSRQNMTSPRIMRLFKDAA